MNVAKITDHVLRALARLLQQYKSKPNIESMVEAYAEQSQAEEDALFDLPDGQSIYGSEGVQLDGLGELFGIDRNNLEDEQYRLFILGKIGENNSDTVMDKIRAIYAVLLDADIVQGQDLAPAGVGLSAGGTIQEDLWQIVWNMVQRSLGGGKRLHFLALFDPEEGFALAGNAGTGLGLGSLDDADEGGKLARLINPNFEFALASEDSNDGYYGLGKLSNPLTGGQLQGL